MPLDTAGLVADYRFNEGTGTSLVDHSGNGNNGTFGSGGAAPSWGSKGLVFAGAQSVSLPVTSAQAVSLVFVLTPDPTWYAAGNAYVFLVSTTDAANTSPQLLLPPMCRADQNIDMNYAGHLSFPGPLVFYNGAIGTDTNNPMCPFGRPTMFAVVCDPANPDIIYRDATAVYEYFNQTTSGPSTYRSGNLVLGLSAGAWAGFPGFAGTLHRLLIYSGTPSPSNMAANYAQIAADLLSDFGLALDAPTTDTTSVLAFEGDSITGGYGVVGGVGNSFAELISPGWSHRKFIWGIAGETVASMDAGFGGRNHGLPVAPSAPHNVYVIFAGTNDLEASATPSVTLGHLQSVVTQARTAGYLVVVVPTLSRVSIDSAIASYDALMPAAFAGMSGVYLMPTTGASAAMYAAGGYANSTNFQGDGTHPTAAGHALLVTDITAAIAAVLAPPPPAPPPPLRTSLNCLWPLHVR